MGRAADSSAKQQEGANVVEGHTGATCPAQEKVDPRVRRTRKLLQDAFRELLSERSYNEVSVGDIAERATVNRATFYAHFEDKGHLASAMVREELEKALLDRLDPPAAFGPESLTRVGAATLEYVAQCLWRCPKSAENFAASAGPTVQETVERFLLKWFEHEPDARRSFPRTTPETMANALAWAFYGAAVRWSRLPRRPEAEAAARETAEIFFRQIGD